MRRAEDQERAPGLGSGSGRMLGGVAAGSSLEGTGRNGSLAAAAADSPYLCCPKYWVTHSPSSAQGRWKLRSQPVSAQLMVAPLPPQTKQCWKEQSSPHQRWARGLRGQPHFSGQGVQGVGTAASHSAELPGRRGSSAVVGLSPGAGWKGRGGFLWAQAKPVRASAGTELPVPSSPSGLPAGLCAGRH